MSPKGVPTIGRPRSLEERERDQQEEKLAADRAEVEYKPKHVEMSAYERQKLEAERSALLEAMRDTRPPRPADTTAPETLNTRVKPAPEPEPVAVEPVIEPDASLVEAAAERQARAYETLAAAQAEAEEADAALVQAQADHEAAVAAGKLAQHHALLKPALARAQRQQAGFQRLFDVYGGASGTNMGKGVTHGPLAKYARTIPVGDPQRRDRLGELFRQAGQLMEQIRVGWNVAREAVEACEKSLTIGGTSEYSEFRLEQAGVACEAASAHDPVAVEQACKDVIAAVKNVDGEPGPDKSERFVQPDTPRTLGQTRAEGVGSKLFE